MNKEGKEFDCFVTVSWSQSVIGKDKADAIANLKDTFKEEFNIELADDEIKNITEVNND